MGGVEAWRLACLCVDQFVEDQEQAIGIDAACIQVVITVFAVVEMEAAELAELDQPGNDHLDVDVRRVVAEIDKTECPFAKLPGDEVICAPVLNDRGVEGRLKDLVFGKEPPVPRELGVDGLGTFQIAFKLTRKVGLSRKIRAVANPNGQGLGADRSTDLDTFQIVFYGLLPDGRIGM